jgi:hypothetical protein
VKHKQRKEKIMNTTRQTKTFIGSMVLASTATTIYAGMASHSLHTSYALAVLTLAAATSRMKVKLPGLNGNMSVNLPFLLAAAINLSAVETAVITLLATAVQCWPKQGAKLKIEQMVFNLSVTTLASSLASLLAHSVWLWGSTPDALAIAVAAATLFLGQTVPVAAIIALSDDGKSGDVKMPRTWWNLAQLSFPYYVIGAGMSSMMQTVDHRMGWVAALAVFPVMYGIYRSYVTYFGFAVQTLKTTPLARTAGAGAC